MMIERLKSIYRSEMQGGITTYILLLFGMSFILYLFGFKSMLGLPGVSTGYFNNASINGSLITNPNLLSGGDLLGLFISSIQNHATMFLIGGGAVAVLSFIAVKYLFGEGTASTIMSYLIPLIFLILIMNLFVFPIATMQADLQSYNLVGLPATAGLFAFFNLFLILAIVDFVRSGQT